MINGLGYFTLETPDIGKARAFYSALLGWTWDEAASTSTYAHVKGSDGASGGPDFGIVKGEKRDFSNLYFQVADVDAACARVTELGGRAAMPADSASGRSVTACDDQGVSFGLWAPAAGTVD
jgi:hypothetical protein